jgi:hypothetical protein
MYFYYIIFGRTKGLLSMELLDQKDAFKRLLEGGVIAIVKR